MLRYTWSIPFYASKRALFCASNLSSILKLFQELNNFLKPFENLLLEALLFSRKLKLFRVAFTSFGFLPSPLLGPRPAISTSYNPRIFYVYYTYHSILLTLRKMKEK